MSAHHSHTHSHSHEPPSFNRAFAISVSLNFLFTLIQIVYAFNANSMSLMADAVHNLGDVLGLLLAWGASFLLTLPARKRYSYGFKKTTVLAALANALVLVATSAIIAYESIHKLIQPIPVQGIIVMVVAFIGILINAGTALLFKKGAHDDLNIKGAFIHLLGDAVISLGVVVGGALIYFTGKAWIDSSLSLLIVVIILWSTWGLLRDSISLMLDAIPRHIDYQGVEQFLKNIPGVTAIHDLHIWGLSTKEIALTVHLIMPEQFLTDADYHQIDATLKDQFKINHATLQVEKGSEEYFCTRQETC